MPIPAGAIGEPYLVGFSPDAAASFGISRAELDTAARLAVLTGNAVATQSDPSATVYSDRQFGVWVGQLDDDRALLLAELQIADGPYEVQLKGVSRTPYSRMGDGCATLRSSIREFLCPEAMADLGILTTCALCITGAGTLVRRGEIRTAAVVTRLVMSFVRFGHSKHFAASEQLPQLRVLADYIIDRFYPTSCSELQPYLASLREIARRTAELMADWQAVSFRYDMMNADNMSILGLTLGYGLFGFLDGFDANRICNHSDSGGRYVYAQQPQIGYWSLFCFAQTLLPLFDGDPHVFVDLSDEAQVQPVIDVVRNVLLTYRDVYGAAFYARYHAEFGLSTAQDADEVLFGDLLKLLHSQRVDYTLFFRHLAKVRRDGAPAAAKACTARNFFFDRAAAGIRFVVYRQRLQAESQSDDERAAVMYRVNPKYALCNRLAETAIRRVKEKDFSKAENPCVVLARPFDDHPGFEHYAQPTPDWALSLEVSCSSRCAGTDTML